MKSLTMTGTALAAAWFAVAAQAATNLVRGRWLTEGKQGVVHAYNLRLGNALVRDTGTAALVVAACYAF